MEFTIVRTQDKAFCVSLSQEGHTIGTHLCSFTAYQAVHSLVDGFRQLLKSQGNAALAAPLLHSVGVELFHLWWAPFWPEIEKKTFHHSPCFLTVISPVADILNLPWELLKWPDGTVLGMDKRFSLRRRPSSSHSSPNHKPNNPPSVAPSGLFPTTCPLKILCLAAAPAGLNGGSITADMELLYQEAVDGQENISFNLVRPATAAQLKKSIEQHKPHIVHLSGPALIRGEQGFFAFEDNNSQADIFSAAEISKEMFAHSGVTMLMVSGQEPAHPPPVAAVAALSKVFVFQSVELALSWPGTLTNPFFRTFHHAFLQNIAVGITVDQALQQARRVIWSDCQRTGYPAWTLPVLYARSSHPFYTVV